MIKQLLAKQPSKKIVMIGLGSLGGGVATANWLMKHSGPRDTLFIFDNKNKEDLREPLSRLHGRFVFSNDEARAKKEIDIASLVVLNPAIPPSHPLVKFSVEIGVPIENEATLFFKNCKSKKIAITGTRGKTTTSNWTAYFLSQQFSTALTGNNPDNPFLKAIGGQKKIQGFVTELPSFHLEIFDAQVPAPDISIITNLFTDHIAWHGSVAAYHRAKSNIYRYQNESQNLIINKDNTASLSLIKKFPPKGKLFIFTKNRLAKNEDGIGIEKGQVTIKVNQKKFVLISAKEFTKKWGEHNLENLLASSLSAYLYGVSLAKIKCAINSLPQIKYRQEKIFENDKIVVYNDTTATSPEGNLAATKRFAGPNTIMILGGTDSKLDYKNWGRDILKHIKKNNLIFLEGSATKTMLRQLPKKVFVKNSLEECLVFALAKVKTKKTIIVLSPGAKSFEKFRNEYDRGEQWNKLVEKLCRKF